MILSEAVPLILDSKIRFQLRNDVTNPYGIIEMRHLQVTASQVQSKYWHGDQKVGHLK